MCCLGGILGTPGMLPIDVGVRDARMLHQGRQGRAKGAGTGLWQGTPRAPWNGGDRVRLLVAAVAVVVGTARHHSDSRARMFLLLKNLAYKQYKKYNIYI